MTISVNLFWILFLLIIAIFLFLLRNFGGIKLFIDKDKELANKFLDKFPLVSYGFMTKTVKEQNIENNQEIHELQKEIEMLNSRINAQNININKVVTMLEELKKRG